MEEKKTEGLLLKATPYLNDQKILKVLTPNDGLISLIAKKKHQKTFLDPFLLAQFVFKKGKSEIHTLIDVSLIHDLSEIRQNLDSIHAAAAIAKDLLSTQVPDKPSGKLFTLASIYLQKIHKISNLRALVSSFRLKVLIHEGLIDLNSNQFAQHCQLNAHLFLSMKESSQAQTLGLSKSLQEITAEEIDIELELKILKLFNSLNA